MNVNEYVLFAPRIGDANRPPSETTWCDFESVFFQVIRSPVLIVTDVGLNAVDLIETLFVAAGAACPAAGTSNSPNATIAGHRLRLRAFPLIVHLPFWSLRRPETHKALSCYHIPYRREQIEGTHQQSGAGRPAG